MGDRVNVTRERFNTNIMRLHSRFRPIPREMSTDSEKIRADLVRATDEEISVIFLKGMIDDKASWKGNVIEDDDVFNKDPREEYDFGGPIFVANKSRKEACGKTDGCESGCWRIIGGAKVIKSEVSEKSLGFKKILKFCEKTQRRGYKRRWVMEEYRLKSKWNLKQDHVFCKIRLLFQSEISSLLAKHYSRLETTTSSVSIPAETLLPDYGIHLQNQQAEDQYYVEALAAHSDVTEWPAHVTTDVFAVSPYDLVDADDDHFLKYGTCFFVNRRMASGSTYGCYEGSWGIKSAIKMIKDHSGKNIGLKRTMKFFEGDEQLEDIFTMEEYRLKKKERKLLCLIKIEMPSFQPARYLDHKLLSSVFVFD